jgi:hypothetical protein
MLRLALALPGGHHSRVGGKGMRSEQWNGRRSLRTWRASVRTRTIGGRLLGIVAAPSREAAELTAADKLALESQRTRVSGRMIIMAFEDRWAPTIKLDKEHDRCW